MVTVQSFAERIGINAPVSNESNTPNWSKPQNHISFTNEELEMIREVWIDTISGEKDGEKFSHRYIFINFDGVVIKCLADKLMDRYPDKTCLEPSKTLMFDRTFLANESICIHRCAGQPNGKIHQFDVMSAIMGK